jgi:hypothetical protein
MSTLKYCIYFCFCLLLFSCSPSGLEIIDDEEIKLVQRGSHVIKGSAGDVELKIDDITEGVTEVEIQGIENEKFYYRKLMEEGEDDEFDYEGFRYRIKLNYFEEHLLHDDFAFFSFRELEK